jgi:hypothetical protein
MEEALGTNHGRQDDASAERSYADCDRLAFVVVVIL